MVNDPFTLILAELSKVFDLPLYVDPLGACSILFPSNLTVQLQMDLSQENVVLFTKIIEIPPGKFRENVLCEALKANGQKGPKIGILAYIEKTNELVLFQTYPISFLDGNNLSLLFGSFLQMGESWLDAIKQGKAAP